MHEGGDVSELAVDGSESDISDLIQGAQGVHHHFPDVVGGDFLLHAVVGELLNLGDNRVNLLCSNRALVAGVDDAFADFVRIKQFAGLVLLDDKELNRLHLFIGGEALAAGNALPPAPDACPVVRRSGIDDLAVLRVAKLAFHIFTPFPVRGDYTLLPGVLSMLSQGSCSQESQAGTSI